MKVLTTTDADWVVASIAEGRARREAAEAAMAPVVTGPVPVPPMFRTLDNQAGVAELLAKITAAAPLAEFEADAMETYAELLNLLVSKQGDYGPSAINRAPGGALAGVMVRIHDKYERLRHLQGVGISPTHEAIRDTYLDLANYAVISLMLIDGTWPRD